MQVHTPPLDRAFLCVVLFSDGRGSSVLSHELVRDAPSAGALPVNIPCVGALSRYAGAEELLCKVRKNLFETPTFAARTPVR